MAGTWQILGLEQGREEGLALEETQWRAQSLVASNKATGHPAPGDRLSARERRVWGGAGGL